MWEQWVAFWRDYGDPRVAGWPLMDSPLPTAAICLTYALTVKVLGPRLMRDRPAFSLKGILIVYNLFQTLFSVWLFQYILFSGWVQNYSLRCQPVDYSDDPLATRMVKASWWYYLSKYSEFFDTFFFVLRKKFDHISTLHVVHHGMMPLSVWFGLKFTPGGHATFFGLLNTLVHAPMYFYYFMAALGPRFQKYLWWKRHLTTFQMVQFVAIFAHSSQLFFHNPCKFPVAFAYWIAFHAVLFFFLFADFSKKTYGSSNLFANFGHKLQAFAKVVPCLNKHAIEGVSDEEVEKKSKQKSPESLRKRRSAL